MADERRQRASDNEMGKSARQATSAELEILLYSRSEALLAEVLENPALREPQLLILLSRRDLPGRIITAITRNASWMRSNSMKMAVLKHPQTPRHLAVPLLKHIYLFDLLAIADTPGLAADLKRLAEDAILTQIQGIALGQKLTLARRGTRRIAEGLLLEAEAKVIEAALENPAMTDLGVAQALSAERAQPGLTEVVLAKQRWMQKRWVMLAVLRNRHLSLARFASLLKDLSAVELADLKQDPRLARNIRDYVEKFAASRSARRHPSTG